MALVLIIGASRGIGLGLVQAYVAQGQRVIATVRNAADKARLQAEGAEVLVVDVANPASVSGLAVGGRRHRLGAVRGRRVERSAGRLPAQPRGI